MRNAFASILFIIATAGFSAFAQSDLDTTFNSTGIQKIAFPFPVGGGFVAVQTDNKIVAVGHCLQGGSFLGAIARYNENGSLDTSFGGTGYVFTDIGTSPEDLYRAVAIQGDGKIVAIGSSGNVAGIVRYNSNGSLDTSFGTEGKVIIDIDEPFNKSIPLRVVIQPDGKILVSGYSRNDFLPQFPGFRQFVARFTATGDLDSTFATGGVFTAPMPFQSRGGSLALQNDGKVLLGGLHLPTSQPNEYTIIRLSSNGTLDPTWDQDGLLTIVSGALSSGGLMEGFAGLAIHPDGRVVGAGSQNVVYRFHTNGSIDTSFDNDGMRIVMPGNARLLGDVKLTSQGSVLVGVVNPSSRFQAFRYTSGGAPDTTFSGDGEISVQVGNSSEYGMSSIAIDLQGRTILGGNMEGSFAIVRLVETPRQSFSISGRVMAENRGVPNAILEIRGAAGVIATARTNPFGYYRFLTVFTDPYVMSVRSKSFRFSDRSFALTGDTTNFDFFGFR